MHAHTSLALHGAVCAYASSSCQTFLHRSLEQLTEYIVLKSTLAIGIALAGAFGPPRPPAPPLPPSSAHVQSNAPRGSVPRLLPSRRTDARLFRACHVSPAHQTSSVAVHILGHAARTNPICRAMNHTLHLAPQDHFVLRTEHRSIDSDVVADPDPDSRGFPVGQGAPRRSCLCHLCHATAVSRPFPVSMLYILRDSRLLSSSFRALYTWPSETSSSL